MARSWQPSKMGKTTVRHGIWVLGVLAGCGAVEGAEIRPPRMAGGRAVGGLSKLDAGRPWMAAVHSRALVGHRLAGASWGRSAGPYRGRIAIQGLRVHGAWWG